MEEQVILVTEQDQETGVAGKMEAHEKGLLHRAFSIFIFNRQGKLLLQRRSLEKYHSGGLWTNSCCSHPRPAETTEQAAKRRLKEEMGFTVPLEKIFDFVYRAGFDNGLTEYEFDHVFAGEYDGTIDFNTDEVMDVRYQSLADIKKSLSQAPGQFTAWFQVAFPKIEAWWTGRYKTEIAS